MMNKTIVDYKKFMIEIEIPEEEFNNTIKVEMRWKEGHYNAETHNSYIKDWWDSGESEDRREWIGQALNMAIQYLDNNWS